jgi:hypothetical protein
VRVRGRAATAQSCGQYVKGLPLAPTVFLVTTTFKQLRTITRNPIHLQAGAKPTAFDSEEIEEERDIHSLIQRALTGNKGKNVSPYRQYIEGVVLGETGVLPPIHLWLRCPTVPFQKNPIGSPVRERWGTSMVINVDKGISGVQYGARPAPIEEDKIDDLRDVALDWIGAYLNTFEEEIRNRETYLASSGPVLAAVGAMGQVLLQANRADRETLKQDLLDSLRTVDWRKGDHWLGIAGNYTSGGVFSVKGTKEVAYAVFNALTDPANGGYARIRRTPRRQGEPEAATRPAPDWAESR